MPQAARNLSDTSQDIPAANELQEFAYIVSHDLNAVLRESVSFSQLLQGKCGGQLDEKAQHYLKHIVHGNLRAQAMLDGLLRYSRLSTGASEMVDGVDSAWVVTECTEALSEMIASAKAEIRIENLPSVRADADQLQQLFMCLLENSLKFVMPGVPPFVVVSGSEEGAGWRFCVRDNGIGIAPKDFTTIFKPLKQLHREEEYPGVGIGLALAKKIVEHHGGSIWVESEPGSGAAFWFTLVSGQAGNAEEKAGAA